MMNDFPLYEQTANRIADLISQETYRAGEKLPSVRSLSKDWRVSMTTVIQAYRNLENRGLIEARPQSGFFVIPQRKVASEPDMIRFSGDPKEASLDDLMMQILDDLSNPDLVPLGGAMLSPADLPSKKLHLATSSVSRRMLEKANSYTSCQGAIELRTEIAKRSISAGLSLHPDDLIVTTGCHEAIRISIASVTKPGDLILIESPSFYGTFLSAVSLGLNVLEIPTSPQTGVCLDALEFALQHHKAKAMITISNYQNPLGSCMPDANKKRLVEICEKYNVALIEDDIYGDLTFDDHRPRTCKAFDKTGNVILCSSFSKTIAPGYRVGWIVPGKRFNEIQRRKMLTNLSSPTITQLGLAQYLEEGGYDHQLRKTRRDLSRRLLLLREMVERYFPDDTLITRPRGGMVLWVELPEGTDSLDLYQKAMKLGIAIAPGAMFSPEGHANHCIRLNGSYVEANFEIHVKKLGDLIKREISKPVLAMSS